MKKRAAAALAAIIAISALTACRSNGSGASDNSCENSRVNVSEDSAAENVKAESDYESEKTDGAIESENGGANEPEGDSAASSDSKAYPEMYDVLPYIDETPAENFDYQYDGKLGGMAITGYTGKSPKVRVPDTLEGEPVVKIKLDNSTRVYLKGAKCLRILIFPLR